MKGNSTVYLPQADSEMTSPSFSIQKQQVEKKRLSKRRLFLPVLIAFSSLFLSTGASYAGEAYVGAWRKGSDGYALYRYNNWTSFTKKWKELAQQNLRLVDMEVQKIGNKTHFFGVWRKGSDGYALYGYNNWSSFTKKWKELGQQNFRLVDIEVEKIGRKTY